MVVCAAFSWTRLRKQSQQIRRPLSGGAVGHLQWSADWTHPKVNNPDIEGHGSRPITSGSHWCRISTLTQQRLQNYSSYFAFSGGGLHDYVCVSRRDEAAGGLCPLQCVEIVEICWMPKRKWALFHLSVIIYPTIGWFKALKFSSLVWGTKTDIF